MKNFLCVNLLTQARKLGLQIRGRKFFFIHNHHHHPFYFQVEEGEGGMYLYENTNSIELARRVFHAIFLPPFFFFFFVLLLFFLSFFFSTLIVFISFPPLANSYWFISFNSFLFFYSIEKCSFYSLWSDGGFER